MRIDDDFRDLAPLRPKLDAERWARMAGSIERAAAPELARRASLPWTVLPGPGLLTLLSGWTRPALSAAAIAALVATVLISGVRTPEIGPQAGVGSALGYPEAVSAWVETGWTPSVEELLIAMEDQP